MLELVERYYAAERQTALVGLAAGLALVALALLLWRASASASLARGLACALLVAGLLQGAASAGYAAMLPGRSAAAMRVYSGRAEEDIRRQEVARMRRVLASGYSGALVTFTALLAFGVVLAFASHGAPVRKGIALALMIAGVLGHMVEALSMQQNREYLEQVETLGP
jgi:hypothetical protein